MSGLNFGEEYTKSITSKLDQLHKTIYSLTPSLEHDCVRAAQTQQHQQTDVEEKTYYNFNVQQSKTWIVFNCSMKRQNFLRRTFFRRRQLHFSIQPTTQRLNSTCETRTRSIERMTKKNGKGHKWKREKKTDEILDSMERCIFLFKGFFSFEIKFELRFNVLGKRWRLSPLLEHVLCDFPSMRIGSSGNVLWKALYRAETE